MINKTRRAYKLIVEQPYCCVPATIQMILEQRGFSYESQEKIGNHLGLIVPPDIASQFSSVRSGPPPKAGYGTQISKEEYSIERYFQQKEIPLTIEIYKPQSSHALEKTLRIALEQDYDIAICYDSQRLFNEGDNEHFSLIESISKDNLLKVIDPAIGAPVSRLTTVAKLFNVLQSHKISKLGGVWLFGLRAIIKQK